MVRPANFGFNAETAINNAFQTNDTSKSVTEIQQKAIKEFDTMVSKLREKGINVITAADTKSPVKPDAVFPNNWVTFHQDGTVITYPMNAANRRLERREDIIDHIGQQFKIGTRIDVSKYEKEEIFLEGTGSVVLDRVNKIAYACLSPRTNDDLLDRFCRYIEYKKMVFHSVDGQGQEIYHTNVMMAMGNTFVVICMDTIKDPTEHADLLQIFKETNKEVIEISLQQMNQFAGNMLQVSNTDGKTFLVMSEQAILSLSDEQVSNLNQHTELLFSNIDTIETYGGGSARCMMAEIFLPEK